MWAGPEAEGASAVLRVFAKLDTSAGPSLSSGLSGYSDADVVALTPRCKPSCWVFWILTSNLLF